MKSTPSKRGQGAAASVKRRWGDGRVAVLGHLEALRHWVGEGRTLTAYYDEHATALGISYTQFARLVSSYVKPLTRDTKRTKDSPPAAIELVPDVVSVDVSGDMVQVVFSDTLPHNETVPLCSYPGGRAYTLARVQAEQLLTKLLAALPSWDID